MIDFHGCSEPTGMQRTYPNILNFEAVRGNECNKWDTTSNPDYHLLFPFIRMLGGPLDYTPGSMRNATRAAFKHLGHGIPFTQGTRCHELAMYVLFDQPLAMLCGSPTNYEKYPDIMKFLSAVPTAFDDTKVLKAEVGKYAMVAKKKGNSWYVGAMTSWSPRELTLDFSFLPKGTAYQADVYTDTPTSNEDAERYRHKVIKIDRQSTLQLHLSSGGGAVIYLHPSLKG
jgi:alpha-glucosidase